jgi:O-antigen/teichoic acid export membrane protein
LVQSVLDYGVKLAVRLVVIPLLVAGLGRASFGVWEMLSRMMGYLESADGRPTHALRLVISNLQSEKGHAARRRWIGAALVVWACFLPLWVATGALLIWLAPSITKVDPSLHNPVRVACAIMMGGVLLGGLAALPESVLRGMNLGYKRMGLQAGLSLVGGALLVGAVSLGTGLVGVALAGVLLVGLTGICFLTLVRRQLPWFAPARPEKADVSALLHMSLWIAAGDAIAKLLLASDVIVLGMVLSPVTVTTYVLTGYAALLAVNLHALAADAVMPGLAGIIGEKSYQRAAVLQRELLAVTVVFAAAAGTAILALNRSFVHLWVGSENFAGSGTNLLLVLIAVQTVFIRCDAYIIDAALQPGRRVRVSALAALVALTFSVLLTLSWGTVGLCLGILIGRAVQSIWYPLLVDDCLNRGPGLSRRWLLRPLLTMALLFGLSAYVGQYLLIRHWALWVAAIVLAGTLTIGIMLGLGLPPDLQTMMRSRAGELWARLGRGSSKRHGP